MIYRVLCSRTRAKRRQSNEAHAVITRGHPSAPLAHLYHTLYNPPTMDGKQLEMEISPEEREQVLIEKEAAIDES